MNEGIIDMKISIAIPKPAPPDVLTPDEDIAKIVNEILTDENLYQNLKDKGLNQIKKYSWQTCAKQTLEIYEDR